MGSEKSPLNSSDSSWARAFLAMTRNDLIYFLLILRGKGEHTLKCLLYVNSFLCAGLEIGNSSFGLAESHSSFRGYLFIH